MNINQVHWAEEHDWFLGYYESGHGYTVTCRGEGNEPAVVAFNSFIDMRLWAGY